MKTLSNSDLKLFEEIVSLKYPLLLNAMTTFLKKNYKDVIMTRDYVYAKGTIPVALVAHLDTVFKQPPEQVYYDKEKGVLWSPDGLGADDRAGVFAIIKIIRAGYRPNIIFTTGEEMGGIGAEALVRMEPECPFEGLRYIIELDRRGTNDCVFYDCANEDFIKYVESFGFCEAIGSYTDICEFCPEWDVAGVNLSIGYENEHSTIETFHVSPFFATISRVIRMLADAVNLEDKFIWVPSKWYKSYTTNLSQVHGFNYPYNTYDYAYGYDDGGWDWDGGCYYTDEIKCSVCGKTYNEYEMFPVKGLDGTTKFYCSNCIIDKVDWCEECSEAFEIDPAHPTERVCRDCKELAAKKKVEAMKTWSEKKL